MRASSLTSMSKSEEFVERYNVNEKKQIQPGQTRSEDETESEQEKESKGHSNCKDRRGSELLGSPVRADRRASESNMVRRCRL